MKTNIKAQTLKPTKRRSWHHTKKARSFFLILLFVVLVGMFSYLTNPFVRFSILYDPNHTISHDGTQFTLSKGEALTVRNSRFFLGLGQLKSGWHVLSNKFSFPKRRPPENVDDIIAAIHAERFNPENLFIISGEHFSVLYPRSLGIFYHSILDPRTAHDETDWKNRQLIYLKTTAYALEVFSKTDRLSTTIVPVGPKSVVLVNFFAPPSDTLYSILYALALLSDREDLRARYVFETPSSVKLQTQNAANTLLEEYKESLHRHYQQYIKDVYNPTTGVVRSDLALSGTKDSVKREGGFYDSVMIWKTGELAQKLGIIPQNEGELAQLKQKILSTYWSEKMGCFYDDLSPEGQKNLNYSSDWLIAYQTGMLTTLVPSELDMLKKCVAYIQKNALDQPLGVAYQGEIRAHQLQPMLKVFLPDYGTTAIWSNWGMEYTKLLIALAQKTSDEVYLNEADRQLSAYTYNIKRYHGYPELYSPTGDMYQHFFYIAVRRTGWVVTFEEAREMFSWTRANWSKFSKTEQQGF